MIEKMLKAVISKFVNSAYWVILHVFSHQLIFFKSTFSKNSFITVSNSLDPNQAQHFVGPDLGPNCLQRLSQDDNSRQRVNYGAVKII